MQSLSKIIVVLLIALSVTACQSSGDKKAETEDEPRSPRKIGGAEEGSILSSIFKKKHASNIILPPDLVSSANDKVQGNHEEGVQANQQEEVLPEVIGAKIVREDGTRWLRVESDAQKVWDTLDAFWAEEQIDLVEYKPAAGLMETDWIETGSRSERDKSSALRSFFNRITGQDAAFDKFRIRLERESASVTNVYISHRATERQESDHNSGVKITDWEWVEKESDPEKVAQLLQVMILLFQSGGQPGQSNTA